MFNTLLDRPAGTSANTFTWQGGIASALSNVGL